MDHLKLLWRHRDLSGWLFASSLAALALLVEKWLPGERDRPFVPRPDFPEIFDPSLSNLKTIEALEARVDEELRREGADRSHRARVVRIADDLVRRRFHHDYSTFAPGDNLILGLLPDGDRRHSFSFHLKAKVLPEDIVRVAHAACSQQAIVLHALLVRLGFRARGLALRGHYVLEVLYEGRWRYLDPNLEVQYATPLELPGREEVLHPAGRRLYYPHLDPNLVDRLMAEARPLPERANLAPNMSMLHLAVRHFTDLGWAFFLGGFVLALARRQWQVARVPEWQRKAKWTIFPKPLLSSPRESKL